MTTPEKMDLTSMNIAESNKAKLKELFPSVFTEIVDEDGTVKESVDFEKLKAELGTFTDLFENRKEHYGMEWPGKKDVMKLIQQPSMATLKPDRNESIDFDNTENLFIEGDNLEVLKLLQKSYFGKVKMIYIDPPYNTGKEFIYPDKYQENLETYLEYAGLIDGEGRKFATNTSNEGRFHTKWLNMMYPRLYLARNLLTDDGVIFISIDDNEQENVRRLCDEIYGEENFISQLVWEKKKKGTFLSNSITSVKEYVLVYSKNRISFKGLIGEINSSQETYPCVNASNKREIRTIPAGIISKYKSKDYTLEKGSKISVSTMDLVLHSDLIIKDGILAADLIIEGNWRYKQELMAQYAQEGNLYITQDLYLRRIVNEPREKTLKDLLPRVGEDENSSHKTINTENLFADGWGSNEDGEEELRQLLGHKGIMDFPKPRKLIEKLCASVRDDELIVLDFFAGSSTTGHAIIDLNKEDYGRRRFILVQLPEPCGENSEALKAGFNTIADIGKDRIKKAMLRIKEEQSAEAEANAGDLLKSQEEQPELDLGFKVFKLDKSNFKEWQKLDKDAPEEEVLEAIQEHIFNIDESASQEDILYEILLKAGFMPTEKVEKLSLAEKDVFSIAEGALLICLEDELTPEVIDAVADAEPMQFICLDKGFQGNDQLKENAVQTFAARNQGREKAEQIVFRTV